MVAISQEAYLPSSTLVRGSADFVRILFVFEDMRLALKGQTDSLDTGRDQPDKHSDLNCQLKAPYGTEERRTATLPWGDKSPSFPITK